MEEDQAVLRALYTPGHATDHFSMLMTPNDGASQSYLFSGDIIMGTPSTSVQEMKIYMDSLYSLRKEHFEHICLPHTADNEPHSIIVDGKTKLEAYIKYREDRDAAIVNALRQSTDKRLSLEELYDRIYGGRGLTGDLVRAAMNNLELHLDKLVKEARVIRDEAGFCAKL